MLSSQRYGMLEDRVVQGLDEPVGDLVNPDLVDCRPWTILAPSWDETDTLLL